MAESIQEALIRARELIRSKDYAAARLVLQEISGDPTASRWLARLNEIDPQPVTAQPIAEADRVKSRSRSRAILFVGAFLLIAVIVVIAVIAAKNASNNAAKTTQIIEDFTLLCTMNMVEFHELVNDEYSRVEEERQCRQSAEIFVPLMPEFSMCAERFNMFSQQEDFVSCLGAIGFAEKLETLAPTANAIATLTASP